MSQPDVVGVLCTDSNGLCLAGFIFLINYQLQDD